MSYSTLPASSDLFRMNSAIHSHRFASGAEPRRDSDSRSPMSEPRSPLFRPSLVAELPPHLASLYNSHYAAAAVAAAVAGQGSVSPSAYPPYGRTPNTPLFYPGMMNGDAWRRSSYLSQFDFWPPGLRSLEVLPRTKAPREATSILKSWLSDHKDNPYPTKSEKMTLSIVTHMTLTQVSTWFANARRRIKKENKMTWTPKARCSERDGSSSNEDESEKDYHRRPLSPYKHHSINSDVIRREYDVGKTLHCPSDSSAMSSRSHSPDSSQKEASAHQIYSSFPRLHPPYYNAAAAASLRGALRHQISSKHVPKIQDSSSNFISTPKNISPFSGNDKILAEQKRSSPPALLSKPEFKPKEISLKPSNTDAQLPFVRIQQMPIVNEKGNGNDDEVFRRKSDYGQSFDCSEKQESIKIVPKNEGEEIQRNFPTHKIPHGEKSLSDENYENEIPSISNTSEVIDPLSCWIRDFQQLVTSGQELKAKQALATALQAVAAKAGAYSGRSSQRVAPFFHPLGPNTYRNRSPSPETPISGHLTRFDRPSTVGGDGSFKPSSGNQKMHCKRSREDDVLMTSPKLSREHEPHTETPLENIVRLRSPYQGPSSSPENTAPINLTKSSPTQTWKRENLTADDTCIEA